MCNTRSGEFVSPQIGKMGTISGLNNSDFMLSDGQVFNIKNDDVQPIMLWVQLAGMDNGDFVETKFECGWNPEIIKTVKQTSLNVNLKWGY